MRHATGHLLLLIWLGSCGASTARTYPVADDEGLKKAIAGARSGDRIALAPGVYAPVEILQRRIDGPPVTVSGKDARIQTILILQSSGWAFDGLTFGGAFSSGARVVGIQNSSDIAVRNSLVHGQNPNNDPWDDRGNGIGVRFSERIEIIGNRFRDIYGAFIIGNSSDVRFEGNSIAFIREGTNWASIKKAVIRCNRFSHFYPRFDKKEHPDAIQSWWNRGHGGNEDFLIEGNAIMTGGPRAVQGIFLAGSHGSKSIPENRMRNFVIRDNIYYGSSPHGITVSGAEGFLIERNTVLPSPHAQQETPGERSADGRRSRGFSPPIRVVGAESTGRIQDNIVTFIAKQPAVEVGSNQMLKRMSNNGKAWSKIFATPPTGDDPPIEHFVGKGSAGARLVCGNVMPPPIDVPSGQDNSTADGPAQQPQ